MHSIEPLPVVMVLLDALRADRALPVNAAMQRRDCGIGTGSVHESFGFQTRPAYFAGLHPETAGMCTVMVRRPATSPFRALRGFRPLLRTLDRRPLLSRIVRRHLERALRRRDDAVSLHGSTLDVPLDLLPLLDFTEKTLPVEGYGGHPSIFSILQQRSAEWAYVGYPFIREYGTDADAVQQFRAVVGAATRFAFLQLNAADGAGHAHGPDSSEYARAVDAYAGHVTAVVQHCDKVYGGAYHLLVFGDHGMVPVQRAIDVPAALRRLPMSARRHTTMFLDSTLCRLWFDDVEAGRVVLEELDAIAGWRRLGGADLERYRIRFSDEAHAQHWYLADPGTVLHPNWFTRTGAPVLGMHGYDPACPENVGALLLSSPALDGVIDLGTVRQVDLFPTTLHLLGLPVPASNDGSPLRAAAERGVA